MKGPYGNRHGKFVTTTVFCMVVFLILFRLPGSFGESRELSLSPQETLRLGERMYREGILPSGEPMQAFIKGDVSVAGTVFSCMSCHLRSGLGTVEGGVSTPPTNGDKLFQPLKTFYKGVEVTSMPLRRLAYTDQSLAEVLRSGVDPGGRMLDEVMPRYLLEDEDMAVLISYLKSLSSQFSPGVSDTTLHFATIITDDVSPEDRDAMLVPLEKFITLKNNQAEAYKVDPRQARMAATMLVSKELAFRRLSLSRWALKGPPETWRSQLEAYYRRGPVFALLGGITNREWKPIHDFCELNHIPCLFPITDFPVISSTDWYTLYLSKGYYQEGEAAARYIHGRDAVSKNMTIVQVVRDSSEGQALSTGFQNTWRELGHQAPVSVTLKAGDVLTEEFLQQVLAKEKPLAIILWDGPEALTELETLAAGKNRPEMVFVSSSYLGKSLWTLKEQVRDFTYITYPYRLPQDKVKSSMGNILNFQVADNKISKQTYSVIQVLNMVLMDMKGNYYRDNFLDVTGMIMDQDVPLYERLSFGPGQRYASKGCYIVQLTTGPNPELVKKSDWVIH